MLELKIIDLAYFFSLFYFLFIFHSGPRVMSRSLTVDFILFSFFILFYLSFPFPFYFSIFRTKLGLGFISHAVTSVTNWWHSHKTDYRIGKNEVEGSRTKWRHTVWTIHAGLMLYSWSFRIGCTVASMDHGE